MFALGVLDEGRPVYGLSGHICSEAVGNWGDGCGVSAGAQCEHNSRHTNNVACRLNSSIFTLVILGD